MIPERRCRRFNPTTVEVFYKWYSYACFANLLYYKNVSENTNNGRKTKNWGNNGAMMGNYKIAHIINNQSLVPTPLPQMGKYIFSQIGALSAVADNRIVAKI